MARGKVIQRVFELKDNFTSGLNKIKKGTVAFRKDVNQLKKAGASAFKGLAVGVAGLSAAVTGLSAAGFAASVKFGSMADEIDKASMRAGVGTTYLQEMRYAMDQVGVSSDSLDKILKRTNQRIGMAEAGSEKYEKALKQMGVASRNSAGEMRSAEEVFDDAVDALSRMENAQDRARLAGEFFGVKTAQDLLPALEAGGDAIRDLRQEAHRLGVVMDEDTVRAGAEFNDRMTELKTSLRGVFQALASPALPVFNKGVTWLTEQMPKLQNFIVSAFDSLKTALEVNRERFAGVLHVVNDIKEGIMGAFGIGGEGGSAVEWFTETAIPAVVDGVAAVFEWVSKTYFFIKDNWSLIGPIVYGIVGALTAYHLITKLITTAKYAWTAAQWALNAAMNANPIGLVVTAIGLLIAAGVLLIKNWDKIKRGGKSMWNAIVDGAEWTANKVVDGMNWMVDKAIKPINALIRGINKIPGINISEIEFGGIKSVDFSGGRFDIPDTDLDEDAEGIAASRTASSMAAGGAGAGVSQSTYTPPEIKTNTQTMANLTTALDDNTSTLKETKGGGNTINVTVVGSDLTAEEIADKLVPRIERKLFA